MTLLGSVVLASSASAATGPELAAAIVDDANLIHSVTLTEPAGADGRSTAVVTDPVAGFPRTEGGAFAVLSTGDAGQLQGAQSTHASTQFSPTQARGGAFDITTLEVVLNVPVGVNCLLGFDFRFLSEEYPDFVGQGYNDAFIAQVGTDDWSIDGDTINAPNNFAFDADGGVISINAGLFDATNAAVVEAAAEGTVFNGATPLLTAAAPLESGLQSLFFTIFDHGDASYDSAVLIDNLRVGSVADVETDCTPGAQALPPLTPVTATAPTFVDELGTEEDTFTIPAVEGVEYLVDGLLIAPGTYPGTGTVVVDAEATDGYVLEGESQFTFTFTDIRPVTAAAPTFVDEFG
ncbi:choice-of-anchor L domain-containing protein, partial [Cellulomonas bogoriensis]|uniref:choice-of-anchor L domain-containing protein n=1 Tax=Cellulomonas bogoriensis TaxID=301388 RepID=UPI000559239D